MNILRRAKGLVTARPQGMEDLFKQQNWVVVGSHGRNPIATQLMQKLASRNKTAYSVNPSTSKVDPSQSKFPVAQYASLTEVVEDGKQIDVVNLVINPVKGINIVKEMVGLKINRLFIQPGAASPEILKYCKENDVAVVEGCVLVSM